MTRSELKEIIKECMDELELDNKSISESLEENDYIEYINENFLDFICESDNSNDQKLISEINKTIKKYKKSKNGEIMSDKECKELFEKISKIADKRAKNQVVINLFEYCVGLTLMMAGSYSFGLAITLTEISTTVSLFSYLAGMLFVMNSAKKAGYSIAPKYFNKWYDQLMKAEAKAKANLLKAEHLEDTSEKVENKKKVWKAIISNCEKMRTNYKSFIKEYENMYSKNKNLNNFDGTYTESYVVNESGDVVLEMKGNQVKVQLFKQIIDDANETLKARYDYIKEVDDALTEALHKISSIKNNDEAAQAVVDLRKLARELDYKRNTNHNLEDKSLADVRKNARKFTNKYAYESVQYKKVLIQKIDKYINAMDSIAKKYDAERGSVCKDIYNAIDQLQVSDQFGYKSDKMIKALAIVINSWQKAIINMTQNTIDHCNAINKSLGKDTEKKIIYKLLNYKEIKANKKENNK